MAQVINEKHLWLLNKFWDGHSKTGTTQTMDDLRKSYENEFGDILADRTFHQYKEVLLNKLGVDIQYDKQNKYYEIVNTNILCNDRLFQWIIDCLSVHNLVKIADKIRNHLFLEEFPGGANYLESIARGIQLKQKIKVTYRTFINEDRKEDQIVFPYAIKTYRRRWYMLALVDNELKHIALDRIEKLEYIPLPESQIDRTRKNPKLYETFSMRDDEVSKLKDYYSHAVGIWVTNNQEAEVVRIRAYGKQPDYLRTLPLHPSQEEVVSNSEYTEFRYYVLVNPDLEREIFARAEELEVISPKSLRDSIKDRLAKMSARYK